MNNEEFHYRINNVTGSFMFGVMGVFDLLQFISKILAPLGLTILTGILGAMFCDYVNINATGKCSIIGGILGFVATFTGIGTVIALKLGMLMSWLADVALGLIGRLVLYFWLQWHGVSVFSGTKAQTKVVTTIVTSLIGVVPLLGTLPDLTVLAATMIAQSRLEDKEAAKKTKTGYNDGEKNYSRMRQPFRKYAPTKT